MKKIHWRYNEALLLLVIYLIAGIGFFTVSTAALFKKGLPPEPDMWTILFPVLAIMLVFSSLHILLSLKKVEFEQTVLPITALIFVLGITMIWRLRGAEGVFQQITRGLIPGFLAACVLLFRPTLLEKIRRWAVFIGLGGLFLLFLTGIFGVVDETGARLALNLGPF
ncbi:MAG: hypothetical protein IH586_01475, partial [Anaerolineaceae bacterium]|nr:hypothetical protein [Anaerolineaceae bacterium]